VKPSFDSEVEVVAIWGGWLGRTWQMHWYISWVGSFTPISIEPHSIAIFAAIDQKVKSSLATEFVLQSSKIEQQSSSALHIFDQGILLRNPKWSFSVFCVTCVLPSIRIYESLFPISISCMKPIPCPRSLASCRKPSPSRSPSRCTHVCALCRGFHQHTLLWNSMSRVLQQMALPRMLDTSLSF